jgi:CubicO group peptidase (beta-lactamase class C family)
VSDLEDIIDEVATSTGFSGVVQLERGDEVAFAKAYGLAHRNLQIPNRIETQFGIASGTKGITALTTVSLIDEGVLSYSTTARSLLGKDLPLVDDEVTVEHLLSHRSGIGDYFDEENVTSSTDYVMKVPVHELDATEKYLAVLGGHPQKFPPGERFSYNNSGYVLLALLAERCTGMSFYDLVERRVCDPAGMEHTSFLRSDELPGSAAAGYLSREGLRTNVLHLPVRGSGDGGIYSTAADINLMWKAIFEGRIVSMERIEEMMRPRSENSSSPMKYGMGFWVHPFPDTSMLEGSDAGVSFRTVHNRVDKLTRTVLSNETAVAWPIAKKLDEIGWASIRS